MKAAPDMRHIYVTSSSSIPLINSIISSKEVKPGQKFKLDPSKTLAQHLNQISRQQWISDAAYYKAENRGFSPGHEHNDWLEAEQDYLDMVVQMFVSEFYEDGAMTINGLQQLAEAVGIENAVRIDSKLELIRAIQFACHHRPCFRTKTRENCVHKDGCLWQADCQKLLAEWWN